MNFQDNVCGHVLNPSGATPFPGSFGMLGTDWILLCALAMLCSLIALAVVFMAAHFLRNQKLLVWCKFEVFQILATAVLAIFIIYFVTEACKFDVSFINPARYVQGGVTHSMYWGIDQYLTGLQHTGELLFFYLMWVVKMLNLMAKITWLSNPVGAGMNDSPLESLGQLNSIFFYLVGGFFTSFLFLGLQMRVLDYLSIATLFYFLPFGIFFRSFEPTRRFGGMLMGFAISMFLFYPILLVVNDFMVYGGFGFGTVEKELKDAMDKSEAAAKSPDSPTNDKIKDASGVLDYDAAKQIGSSVGKAIFFLLKPLVVYFIAAIVLPAINFMAIVEITRGLTAMFGEEMDVSNLTRMI